MDGDARLAVGGRAVVDRHLAGTCFTPAFLHTAPRWLAATVLRSNSPGGIAEMRITAKVFDLGVAVLTGPVYVRFVKPRPH